MNEDKTPKPQADSAVAEGDARLRALVDTIVDGVVIIDAHGTVQSFNPASEALFGYSAEEAVGRNIKMLMPAPYREEHDGYLEHYRQTGERRIIGIGREVTGLRKDGTAFPILISVGETVHEGQATFVGVIRDLSATKATEDELRHAHRLEAVGQLTGGIAHDFNNLLTVIVGNLEMLEAQLGDDPDKRESIGQALEAAELGAELTGRLLAFARRQPLAPKVINLNDLVTGLSPILRRTLGESIQISTLLAPDLAATLVDPGQVENAVLNLAVNARDAMAGGGVLTIETANAELDEDYAAALLDLEPGFYVQLSITDTGTGMAAEVRARAFEPFFTTKGKGAGTGLGLSQVYGFVKQSGGHARIYSEPGHGTTVNLYLPPAQAAPAAQPVERRAAALPAASGEIVLVVEDDPRVRRLTLRRLTELGYGILEAADGQGALDVLAEPGKVDLLFTDMVMPGGISGADLAREAQARRPELKVLFTSGYARDALTPTGEMEEGALLLRKPYRLADLAHKLREALES